VQATFGAAVTAAGSAGNGLATYMAKIVGSVTGATGPIAGLSVGISNLFRNIVDGQYKAAASAGDFNAIGSSLARNVGRIIGGLAGLIGVAGKVYFAFEALNKSNICALRSNVSSVAMLFLSTYIMAASIICLQVI
jgi:hypothetical protein